MGQRVPGKAKDTVVSSWETLQLLSARAWMTPSISLQLVWFMVPVVDHTPRSLRSQFIVEK